MATYRPIHVKMWGDEKFKKLSAPPPCGRYLWIYLLTGPHTTNIPGLFSAGEAQLAEALEWPLEGFREAFREAFREGLIEADWKARLVFIANGIKHNPPQSPNVVKSWKRTWNDLPESAIKTLAYQSLKAFLEGYGKAFAKAFREAFPEALGIYTKTKTKTQHIEAGGVVHETATPTANKKQVANDHTVLYESEGFGEFWNAYPKHDGKLDAAKAWKRLSPPSPLREEILKALEAQARQEGWTKENGRYIPRPATWLNGHRWEDEMIDTGGNGSWQNQDVEQIHKKLSSGSNGK